MGTDGAAVMLGKTSGVVKRIADITGRPIQAIHCSAHRLELAFKDGIKNSPIHKKCDLLLLNLYLFYKYSPLNRSNLKASFASLREKVLLPTRMGGTRWLPHTQRALNNIIGGYSDIIQHLEQMQATPTEFRKDSSAKGRNFLKLLKDKCIVYWLHFMMDVIKGLASVSLVIQNKNCTLADIWEELEGAKAILVKYKSSDGPYVRKLKYSDTDNVKEQMQQQKIRVLTSLLQCMEERYLGDMRLFQASTILAINKWPSDLSQSPEYGDEQVATLLDICQQSLRVVQDIDLDAVKSEWTRLKTALYSRNPNLAALTWASMYSTDGSKYPNFFHLVDYLLSLPGSSVDAERGFSRMKIVKNDWRSRLGEMNLSDLLLLCIETEPIADFNPTKAIELWYTGGVRARRPFYKDDLKRCRLPRDQVIVTEGTVSDVTVSIDEDAAAHMNIREEEENILEEEREGVFLEGEDNCDSDSDNETLAAQDLRDYQITSYSLLKDMMED